MLSLMIGSTWNYRKLFWLPIEPIDSFLDDLEDAQEQIICAKDEISEEYANVFKKKFHEEIASFIGESFIR